MESERKLVSIVIPAYNEQEVLPEFHRRLAAAISAEPYVFEIVYANDGSVDSTWDVMLALKSQDSRVALVNLSRNFGKEIALTAGLDKARGTAVVVIDADLQDPPELIPSMIRKWEEGTDVVYAKRNARRGESLAKRGTAYVFYRVMQSVSRVKVPEDSGDFRLLSRRALDAVLALREQHRYMKGLFAWVGFSQVAVVYDRDPRAAGTTKWNYWKLWNFALEGITSFTTVPLRFTTYLGLAIAFISFIYGSLIVIRTLLYGSPVPGYPSLLTVVLFLGGAQLTAIGILGEYLGRVFNETKKRPLYFLSDYLPSDSP
jgi:glycosyltransferase involved in cell wall biosynthesis